MTDELEHAASPAAAEDRQTLDTSIYWATACDNDDDDDDADDDDDDDDDNDKDDDDDDYV